MFGSNRGKLAEVRAELKKVKRSRSARNARRLDREVARLEALLKAAGAGSGRNSAAGLRREIFRLKELAAKRAERLRDAGAENERLRASGETRAKARFGRSSEKKTEKDGSGSGRRRGQQEGGPGHGRTRRPKAERCHETRDPPEADRVCPCRGLPYVRNGGLESGTVEMEIRVHVRTIRGNRSGGGPMASGYAQDSGGVFFR